MSDDLPTPDEPMKPTVRPVRMCCAQIVEADSSRRARAHHRHADRRALDRLEQRPEVGIEIDFVQHDDGLCAAVPDRRHVALEAALVEVAIRGRDDEEHVDVRRDDLRLAFRAGRAPDERRTPIEHVLNRRAIDAVDDRDPVADDRAAELVERLHQAAAEIRERRAATRDVETALPFRDDSRGRPAGVEPRELAREEVVEAEGGECRQAKLSLGRISHCRFAAYSCRADRASVVPQYAPSSRGVAQPGRALRSGRRGRRFKSYHPDQFPLRNQSPRGTRATPALCVSFVRDFCVTAWGTITRSTVWRCSQTLFAASTSLAISGAL